MFFNFSDFSVLSRGMFLGRVSYQPVLHACAHTYALLLLSLTQLLENLVWPL